MDKKYKEDYLNPKKWALFNKETSSIEEFKDKGIKEVTSMHQVSIHYKSYFSLDTDRLQVLLLNGIKDFELGLLIIISSNLHSFCNFCRKIDDTPHNTESISKIIGQTVQATKKKLNRLIQQGALAYKIIPKQKHLGKVYIVNPYLIRRGRNLDEFLDKLFFDIVISDNKQNKEIKKFAHQLHSKKSADQPSMKPNE